MHELNCLRKLPADYPNSGLDIDTDSSMDMGTYIDVDTDEEGIDPSEPIITTSAQVERTYQYVARTGVVRHIDEVLPY